MIEIQVTAGAPASDVALLAGFAASYEAEAATSTGGKKQSMKKPPAGGTVTLLAAGSLPAYVAGALHKQEFEGDRFGSVSIVGRDAGEPAETLILGVGAISSLGRDDVRRLGGHLGVHARQSGDDAAHVVLPTTVIGRGEDAAANLDAFLEGVYAGAYYFSRKSKDEPPALARVTVYIDGMDAKQIKALQPTVGTVRERAAGIYLARDLINMPSNECTPAYLETVAKEIAKLNPAAPASGGKKGTKAAKGAKAKDDGKKPKASGGGLTLKVLDKAALTKKGFGGILAVNQGSAIPARLIMLEYTPAKKPTGTVAFVGKGITFDTGGYSLKPSDAQPGMKADMGGAATVIGIMRAVVAHQPSQRVIGLVPTTENLVSATAYRVDDVITMKSGHTVEILNTDAEGRMVLADAITWACEEYKADVIVDFATLTGAALVALGKSICAGLFSPDDALIESVQHAATTAGERVWRLPIYPEHHAAMKSKIADLKNSGGRPGGSSTAAAFLQAFVTRAESRWAHVDIAPMMNTEPSTHGYDAPGAMGYGVRLGLALLDELAS